MVPTRAACLGLAAAMMAVLGCWSDPPNPDRWAEIELGMTTTEVREIMGPPDEIDDSFVDEFINALFGTHGRVSIEWTYRTEDGATYIDFDGGIVTDIRHYSNRNDSSTKRKAPGE